MTELIRDFLDPAEFYKSVQTISEIDFFCGVPDSLLKGNKNKLLKEKLDFNKINPRFLRLYFDKCEKRKSRDNIKRGFSDSNGGRISFGYWQKSNGVSSKLRSRKHS